MPLLGAAIGGATGAAAGAATDVGVDDKFMKELGEKLQPGGAAVFVLVRQSTPDKVLPRISQYGGDVIHSSLSQHAEETLQEALRASDGDAALSEAASARFTRPCSRACALTAAPSLTNLVSVVDTVGRPMPVSLATSPAVLACP